VIRVLLGHRGALVREALATVLAREGDLDVVARVAHREQVLPAAVHHKADVAVLDWGLPGRMALPELCEKVHADVPGCGVLILLDTANAGLGADLARAAPRVGLIATESTPADLIEGVRQIARGEPVVDVEVAVAAVTAEVNPLTDRERDVLRLAEEGAPAKEIARSLFLSTGTVRNYLSRIVAKTGARTRIEAIRIAQDAGWI